jgi:dTDP-4-dehydrorhamnose 3,5-epimerase
MKLNNNELSDRFNFISTTLDGLFKIEHKPIKDSRGFLNRLFCTNDFQEIGFNKSIIQMNHTLTKREGVVRGLHYQNIPHTEAKIVSCVSGEIFDVVVDIRKNSPTFLKWHSEILSSENNISIYIPEGFAHGFQSLSDNCNLIYMHSNFYSSNSEAALNALDPKLEISWPLVITEMSERDKEHPMISSRFKGIDII